MAERRAARVPQKVVHRHRIGSLVFKRVSEFVRVRGEPKAILKWIDIAGMRTPIYVDLDSSKLRRVQAGPKTRFFYAGTTVEPGTPDEPRPAIRGRRGAGSQPMPGGRRRTDPPLGHSTR
jgi:hypothetical protein